LAAAKVSSIAKRRRQASARASALETNSSNAIGRLRVHRPPGERKSGMPHSVEIPAPVKGTIQARFGDHVAELLDAAAQILGNHR
jgi:hypothetical protein